MYFLYLFYFLYRIQDYTRYSHLWDENRVQKVQDFVDTNPLNVIIRDMFKRYENQTEEVLNLPERHIIGSIQIDMGTYLYIYSTTIFIATIIIIVLKQCY